MADDLLPPSGSPNRSAPDQPTSARTPAEHDKDSSRPNAPRTRRARLAAMIRGIVDAQPEDIESAVRDFGQSRPFLAPVAWAAGALVLSVHGIKLLLLNWRLSLIELVPAAWVWLVMWDLKRHALRGEAFQQLTVGGGLLLVAATLAVTVLSFWCNTVFAFAIESRPPRIRAAAAKARPHLPHIAFAGGILGAVIAAAAIVVPRIGPGWLYVVALGAVLAVLLSSFVAIPARLIGASRQKLPPKQAIGRMAAGEALSAVAMTPGFLLDRLGLIMLGVPGLHIIGLFVFSVGTALYAAGMSSVRAVKLAMKLDPAH